MKARLLSPDAEEKRNLLFDRLIKNYNYKAADSNYVSRPQGFIKSSEFELKSSSPTGSDVLAEKKKLLQNSDLDRRHSENLPGAPSKSQSNNFPSSESKKAQDLQPATNNALSVINKVKNKLKSDYDTRLVEETEKAYQKGLLEGKTQGLNDGLAQINRLSGMMASIKAELEEKSAVYFEELEQVMIDFSTFLTQKIIDDAAGKIPEVIKSNVRQCTGMLTGSGKVLININPEDYQQVQAFLPELSNQNEGKYEFIVEPKDNISRGGCTLELNGSVIDGRIETQIENLRTSIAMLS